MKRTFLKIFTTMLAAVMLFSVSACSKSESVGSDDPNSLDIYLLYKGYGDRWLKDVVEVFKTEEWVKQKYPKLKVNIAEDGEDARARRLLDNPGTNKFDILFGVNLKPFETTDKIIDLTDKVYLADVPGENVKVKDKLPQRTLENMRRTDAASPKREDGNDSYYAINYIDGAMGLLYNNTILTEQLGLEVPLTTAQFMEIGKKIKESGYETNSLGRKNTVILNYADNNYWEQAYTIWWAQYVGQQGYNDFFEGYDENVEMDKQMTVLDQKGRLEALTALSDVLSENANMVSDLSNHEAAQAAFLMGNGVFHFNGDYFTTEMANEIDLLTKKNQNYDIKYMKMPIISDIINNLPDGSIKNDAELRTVISKIDSNLVWSESGLSDKVTKRDYEKISEARGISMYSAASGQVAIVPSVSAATELACDFLRFMYTDKAIKTFSISTKGIIFPSTYDFYNDAETFAKFDNISKSKLEITRGTDNFPFVRLQIEQNTKLGSAGLKAIYFRGKFENVFIKAGSAKMTPQQILDAEKNYWKLNWDVMVSKAQ